MSSLIPFLILLLGAWIWLDGARAREFANTLARRYCENRGMQFLDETVSLTRFGLRWTKQGLRIRRMFRFDFSIEGLGRHSAFILMIGSQLELIDDGMSPGPQAEPPASEGPAQTGHAKAQDQSNKVIPFRRKDP